MIQKYKYLVVFTITALCILICAHIGYKFSFYYRLNALSVHEDKNGNIVLNGPLNNELFSMLKTLEEKLNFQNRLLIVRSSGGDLVVGMDIGRIIYKYKMNVEVNEFCASSCANYIFTAANKKYVSHNSGLIFHGGARQTNLKTKAQDSSLWGFVDYEASIGPAPSQDVTTPSNRVNVSSELVSYIDYLIEMENDFFKLIRVNPNITIYGQLGDYSASYLARRNIGFHYTISDLKKFGVENVYFIGSGVWRPHTNPYNGSPYWVKVDETFLHTLPQ